MEKETMDVVHVHDEDHDPKAVETKVVHGNTAFHEAMIKEPPNAFSSGQLWLYAFSLIGFFCSTCNGYDGSLINLLLQNDAFVEYYDGSKGIWQGIISAMYQIGGVVCLPFISPVVDGYGRRVGMLTGALIIIIGTIIQGVSHGAPQFMGGRFLLGFGVSLVASAGPMYVVEINHPAYRGRVGGMYNTLWFSGSILASGAARATIGSPSYSWRLITWLQLLFSAIIALCALFLPESPRWLYVHNKRDKAMAMLTKYHGGGDENSVWVTLQLSEYEEFLNMNGEDKRWWDYRGLFRDRPSIYRIGCNLMVSIWGQWAGNAVLSYYLGDVLDTAGYRSSIAQANITLINNCQQFAWAIFGAFLVDRVGRRPLFLFSMIGCTFVWMGMTIACAQFDASQIGVDADGNKLYSNHNASKAALAMIFIFGAVYSVGVTPLQALLPVEVLNYSSRAKGMAFSNLAVNATGLLNQFAWPVSLKNISWKTYIIFTIWDAIQALVVYLVLPETKGYTLEELDNIFTAKNPVKASLAKQQVAVDSHGDVVDSKEV